MKDELEFDSKQVIYSKDGHDLFDMTFLGKDGEVVEYTGINQKHWSVIFPLKVERTKYQVSYDIIAVESFVPIAKKKLLRLPAMSFSSKNLGPAKAAARALHSRTGYACDEENITPLAPVLMSSSHSETKIYCFLAEGCKKVEEIIPEYPLYLEPRWLSLNLWLDMIALGKIEESSSIMATMLALQKRPELLKYYLEYLDYKKNVRD